MSDENMANEEKSNQAPENEMDNAEKKPGIDPSVFLGTNEAPPEYGDSEFNPDDILSELEAERDTLKDQLLRSLAEADNIRKRAERDRRDAENYGASKFARDMLSVYDNLQRAMDNMPEDVRNSASGFVEGIDLTQKELITIFAKHKITPIVPAEGDAFDPTIHEAMFEAPVPGKQPGTIIQVNAVGFMIADRLLRPAQVGVCSK